MEASIKGQSTFGMEGTDGEKMEKLQIVEAASALRWKPNMFFFFWKIGLLSISLNFLLHLNDLSYLMQGMGIIFRMTDLHI